MKVARMLGVTGLLLGGSLLLGSPMAFADGDMGPPSGGCPPSGCVNTSTPPGSGGPADNGSDTDPPQVEQVDPPPVQQVDPPQVPARPQTPPVVSPPLDFIPADRAPADVPADAVPPPVLTQDAVSRGVALPATTAVNVVPVSQSAPAPATSPRWGLIIPALVVAAAGAGLASTRSRRPALPVPSTPPTPPPSPPPFSPPAAVGGFAGAAGAGEDFINPWWIITDGRGNFSLAHLPTFELPQTAQGPFFTFGDGAAAMAALGVPGWP